jgi:nucleotide-binding universal stress UspA family protein
MTRSTPDTGSPVPDSGVRSAPPDAAFPPTDRENDVPRAAVWTFPPRRILVPVDFGDASARAVTVAGGLASRFGAAMTALHADIIEAPAYFTHEQARAIERERHGARLVVERELKEFVTRARVEHARVRFVEESPATAIVEAARGTDLIVMGTHGRRGPSRWWLGSVAERVIREVNRPVLVVRSSDSEAAVRTIVARPLMVAGPLTFEGEAARYAAGLAEAFGGVVAEQAASCEQDLARERDATLLVVAGMGIVRSGWFGTSAEKLIRSCALPMLFVPSGA